MRARGAPAAICLMLAPSAVAAGDGAQEVATWLTGTFERSDPAAEGSSGTARVVAVAVPKSRIANGALVLYREQASAAKLDVPSSQRFLRLEGDGDAVRLRAFDPKDPLIVRGKWRDPSALALYGANDMRERPGCAILLRKSGDHWEGGTTGAACPSAVRGAATMTTSLVLSKDGFTEWDRGFDEKGRQTWGPLDGGTRFVKRSADAPVDDRLMERPVGKRAGREEPEEGVSAKSKNERPGAGEATPAAGEAKAGGGFSANGKEGSGGGTGAATASSDAALTLASPYSPSKKYTVAEIREADSTRVPLRRIFSLLGIETEGMPARRALAPAVLLVTGRDGYSAAFSVEEALAADGPELDLANSPGIVYPKSQERSVHDVVSIELKLLAENPKP